MADKPSRALVIFGDGLARGIDAPSSHSHLHFFASLASCGFLSLPNASPSVSESEDERILREFALLLDACDQAHQITGSQHKDSSVPSISERFMGMKAAVVTNSPALKSFCGNLGFYVLRFNDLVGGDFSCSESSAGPMTSQLMNLLGFQDGRTLETSQFDLVFVHIGAGGKGNGKTAGEGVANDVDYVNALVGGIMQVAQPGSEVGSRLHLSVVMSYGRVMEGDGTIFSVEISRDEMDPVLQALFPCQSYTMRGEKPREDVRHYCPMLIAQWQYAVTRVDMAEAFSFKDFKEHGGNLVIPADRFLHEVAFKLWKAPKYGA